MPSHESLASATRALSSIRPQVLKALRRGRLSEAVGLVDEGLLIEQFGLSRAQVKVLREAQALMSARRSARGAEPRVSD